MGGGEEKNMQRILIHHTNIEGEGGEKGERKKKRERALLTFAFCVFGSTCDVFAIITVAMLMCP